MAHKIKFPTRKKKRNALSTDLSDLGFTFASAETKLISSIGKAREMAQQGFVLIDEVYSTQQDAWVDNWNKNTMLVRWFGEVSADRHVKKARRRMKSARDRLNKNITIRVRPETENSPTAQNAGWFIEPKTFKVFPPLLSHSKEKRAAIMIHELIHLWFTDQRIDGETVYGLTLALQLAEENPRRARRSAENYEQFCFELNTNF